MYDLAVRAVEMPTIHRDPIDRILIAVLSVYRLLSTVYCLLFCILFLTCCTKA